MKNKIRMLDWLLVAVALFAVVAIIAPHQLPVSLYKLSLLAAAAFVGYRIDRSLFPYARPDLFDSGYRDTVFAAAQIRRAIIVGCAMLAVGLGA